MNQEPLTAVKPAGWRKLLPYGATVEEVLEFLFFSVFFLAYGLTPFLGGDGLGLVGADEPRYAEIAREMLGRFDAAHTLLGKLSACVTPYLYGHAWLEKPALYYWRAMFLGGDGLGLVGADEPRYAEIAREMLGRFDSAHTLLGKLSACVTPYLYGHPWLEKPALYYWRAMFLFKDFGVHDWSARLPSTTFAFILVALIYLHMRRFRPGGHLDAALITVTCAAIIGFARGASTDMQLAAPLSIGLLGWYAWYETGSKFWLYDIYFFTGLATLAKGPVAPFLALLIVGAFALVRREWSIIPKSLWWPGVALYFAMVLPWFIAVQHQNPTFFREFFLQQNLQRFSSNRYHHEQPFWYYLVVVVLAMMPWTVPAIRALIDGIKTSVTEWRLRHSRQEKPGPSPVGDAFPEFLVLWALIPIAFFSFSKSKLPGYILPSIPPIAILTGDYLFRRRRQGVSRWLLVGHALVCGLLTATVLLMPWFVAHGDKMPPGRGLVAALLASTGAALLILIVASVFGIKHLRLVTSCVLMVLMLFIYGVGPFFGIPGVKATKHVIQLVDDTYSSRPLAEKLDTVAPPNETVAVFRVRRETIYGLSFYRKHHVVNYEESGVPNEQHLLVARVTGRHGVDLHTQAALGEYLQGRHYEQLFSWPDQGLIVYLVGAR